MARRILVAIVAAGAGLAVYAAGFPRWFAIAVGLGVLVLADRLGLLVSVRTKRARRAL